jgi:hypothetical protein
MYGQSGREAGQSSIGQHFPPPVALGALHGSHQAARDFADPENCWAPGATHQPNWSKTLLRVEAELKIPATCKGSITARTTLRDVVPGGATAWADAIRFGVSDGTHAGGLEQATKVDESAGTVDFIQTIPWDGKSCTVKNDLFVYVKFPVTGVHTFVEVGFYPRITSSRGVVVDNSPPPAIRLHPCDRVNPVRGRYIPGAGSKRYWKLPTTERRTVSAETSRRFRQETGIDRKLDWNAAKDRLLARHWLRIRDDVVAAK